MSKGQKDKRPSSRFQIANKDKNPRGGFLADRIPSMPFRWRLDKIDMEGAWGWSSVQVDILLRDIIPKLHDYESMTWGDIEGKTGSHFVSCESCIQEAQDRLENIQQSDVEDLFSLRMNGKNRIWGIRDIAVLRILWWDPDHAICPSAKKHT